jgi:hypothetical protein
MQGLSDNNLDVVKDTGVAYHPIFEQILEDIPGGGTIKVSEIPPDMTELLAGTVVAESSSTSGLFNIVKSQKSNKTQTTSTTVTLLRTAKAKGLFKVGEYIGIYGQATISTVVSVTRTSSTVDTIVVGTALGALATASIVVEGAAAATVVAVDQTDRYTAIGMIRDNIRVREDDLKTLNNINVGIVVRGTVNEAILPYAVTATTKTNLTDRMRFA